MKRHEKIHNGDKRYECKTCGKKFIQSNELKSHEIKHIGSKAFICYLCDKTFYTAPELKSHNEKYHTEEKLFQCQFCDKYFGGPKTLRVHERTHINSAVKKLSGTNFKEKAKIHANKKQFCQIDGNKIHRNKEQ